MVRMIRDQINIRVSKELKDHFYSLCKKEHITPSILLRYWMKSFLQMSDEERKRIIIDVYRRNVQRSN